MSHSSPTALIRGGQTTQHWWRMAGQVLKTALFVGVAVYLIAFSWMVGRTYELPKVGITYVYWLARYNVENRGAPDRELRYRTLSGEFISEPAGDIYANRSYRDLYHNYEAEARRLARISLLPAVLAAIASFGVFYFTGRNISEDEHVRGTRLVSREELKRWSKKKWKTYRKRFGKSFKSAPVYTIAGIPFPPNAVEAQTGIFGTVGVGKTNAIRELLITIRAEDGRAIIYDRMGGLVRDFYDPERDVIVNPFDARSAGWSPFGEAFSPEAFAQIAEVMIPERKGTPDPFWTQTARIVFEFAARKIQKDGKPTNAKLRRAILEIPAEDLAKLIEGTPGRHFFNESIEKTAASIRANLVAELRFLEYLRDDAASFSVRDWVRSDAPGFVFLTGDAEHSAATRNIISTIFEVAANALMTLPESNDPRIWFFLDEVPTLNRLPFLPKSLAEIRQFGGAFVLGYQVYSQLEDVYGREGAQTILGNLNNRIVFNTPDARTAKLFAESLGSEDVVEMRESLSLGAHATRDGVGFMAHRTERLIVTPSQIQGLPQFEAYIRFAYDAPTAFVRFDPVKRDTRAEKFLPYHGAGFDEGGMELARVHRDGLGGDQSIGGNAFATLSPEVQLQEFRAWYKQIQRNQRSLEDQSEMERTSLWNHFATGRIRGLSIEDIPPPHLSAQLMQNGPSPKAPISSQPSLPFPTQRPATDEAAEPSSKSGDGQNQSRKRIRDAFAVLDLFEESSPSS